MNPELSSAWNMLSDMVSSIDDIAGPTTPEWESFEMTVAAR